MRQLLRMNVMQKLKKVGKMFSGLGFTPKAPICLLHDIYPNAAPIIQAPPVPSEKILE